MLITLENVNSFKKLSFVSAKNGGYSFVYNGYTYKLNKKPQVPGTYVAHHDVGPQ